MAEVEEFRPKIIGFFCNWCTYVAADSAGASKKFEMPADLAMIRVMCSGRVDPVMIATAFIRGADGVLLTGCHPEECHYEKGNFYARKRFLLAKQVIESLGLEGERLKLAWMAADEKRRFTDVISEFSEDIKKLGENPIKNKTSL